MRPHRAIGMIAAGGLLLSGVNLASAPGAGANGFGFDDLKPIQKRHVSGIVPESAGAPAKRAAPAGVPVTPPGCTKRRGSNIKINQDCLNVTEPALHGRSQAQNETWVTINPHNGKQILAGTNDYRRGDGQCGVHYSRDGGKKWADASLPANFVNGAGFGGKPRQYLQAGGDPAATWDSRGNAYYACLQFSRGEAVSPNKDLSNGIYVYRSTGTAGASWSFTGKPATEFDDTAATGDIFEDKEFIVADHHKTSKFRDRVYVTWTRFTGDGTAYIYATYSADYGKTFSKPVVVSSDSAMCAQAYGLPTPHGKCNSNQFSYPVVGADGTLHVVWANYNSANAGADNRYQIFAARSADGGATFSAPVKSGDFYDLPDCDTYQGAGKNPGRGCVPEKGNRTNSFFRAANYPMADVHPRNPKKVVVTYGSYIGRNSNEAKGCTPQGFTPSFGSLYAGVKAGGCNNDIVLSTSSDGGASFNGTSTNVRKMPVVTSSKGQATTDQYWQGTAYSPRGTLVTAYYDRQYGDDARNGNSDVSLTTSKTVRVTSSSMPPPTQFNGQFFGDYMMVDATATHAYPVWMDTRAKALFPCQATVTPAVCTGPPPGPQDLQDANDQDAYAAKIRIG